MGVSECQNTTTSTALMTLADAEIAQAVSRGNLSALAILYRRYGSAVYRLACRILGSVDEAEDLTQEVFLAFWQGQGYDPSRGTVVVFLLTLTRSRALNRLKQVKAQQQRHWQWQQNQAPNSVRIPFENASLEELAQQVSEALTGLPDGQRRVLEMAYYDGLSQSEITKRLNLPLGTVKTRSRLGLLKLRELLKGWIE
ncbi:MAG: sigma-70 family RNA polymerase sigma factor [Cyanobacteria bacterium P01_E01_bin.43]